MSFFPRERSSLRNKSSQHTYDYNQHYNDMLNGLNGNFTFGGSSGFTESPYEIFRQNVAKYCERFMYSSFDQNEFLSAEEKSLRALRMVGDPGFNARLAEGDEESCGVAALCAHADLTKSHAQHPNCADFQDNYDGDEFQSFGENENRVCNCSGHVICKHCQARPSKSDTNIFSVTSVSFEPLEDPKARKPSLLKKITHLMNSDYNSHKEKVTVSMPLKQRCEPSKWNACECHVHIGKHSNCCQCQEPYHRTYCECVQHNGSHSYCCRCDPHLLQEYDQHIKKKRYLRLLSDDEELSPVNSVDYQDGGIPRFPRSSPKAGATETEGRKSSPKSHLIPSELSRPGTGDRPCNEKDNDTGEFDSNHHPCESCCKKLDNIYGTALREVHSMLMDVSRTLLPSAHCCSLETRIQNVSRLRPSSYQIGSQNLDTVESNVAEPEWTKDVSGTNEVGVQVTPNDLTSGEWPRKKMTKRVKHLKNKCIVS